MKIYKDRLTVKRLNSQIISKVFRNKKPKGLSKTLISNLVRMTGFWDRHHQIRSWSKD